MITKPILIKLIYIEYMSKGPNVEHVRDVRGHQGEVYNSVYYNNLNRGVRLEKSITVKEYNRYNYNNGELKYAIIDNVRYKIEDVTATRSRSIVLQLSEER